MLLLILKAGVNRYAIDVTRVIELVPRVELRKIPHAPRFLAGLLDYRGKAVPVIDLGLLLDVEASRDWLSTRIVVVNDSGVLHMTEQGLIVDPSAPARHSGEQPNRDQSLLGLIGQDVSELARVRPEQLGPAPVQLAGSPFLGAIVHLEGAIVQLIAVERIRETALAESLPDPELARPPAPTLAGQEAQVRDV
jgi:chemotaxis-related protein WspB